MYLEESGSVRADRLLTVVQLLRQHGRMSAAELARRLEVTPRTVMRDIEALSLAGVPIYAERGRRGGYALLPGYRPAAEDLSPDESGALLLAGGADVAVALGLGESFARAARRLASGLPDAHARQVGHLLDRVVIDPAGWGGAAPHPEFLEVLFDAVRQDRRVRMDYRALSSGRGGRRLVDPWGLVLAGSTWYLIAAHRGSPHTYRLSRIASLTVLPERSRRPDDLDLVATWRDLRAAWNRRPTRPVVLRIRHDQADLAQRTLRMVLVGDPEIEPDDAGRDDTVILRGEVTSLRGVVGLVLGFGDWVEVLEPPELRTLMVEIAQEALGVYAAR